MYEALIADIRKFETEEIQPVELECSEEFHHQLEQLCELGEAGVRAIMKDHVVPLYKGKLETMKALAAKLSVLAQLPSMLTGLCGHVRFVYHAAAMELLAAAHRASLN